MAGQPEVGTYDPLVYQWESTDPVQGGRGGVANTPLLNLANRTGFLLAGLNAVVASDALKAPINGLRASAQANKATRN